MATITPEQARVELAKRELERRQSIAAAKDQSPTAYSEIASPLLSGVSSAAFGIPKYLVNKYGGEKMTENVFPEQQTAGGKALRFGSEAAGLLGGGAAKIGLGIAERAIPKIASSGLGLKAGVGAIENFNRAKMMGNIGRSAIAGGVGGATQILNPDTNVEQQLTQGLSGTVIGGAVPMAMGLKGVQKMLQRSAQVGKPSVAGEREIMRGQLTDRVRSLVSDVNKGVSGANEKLAETTKQISEALKSSTIKFGNNVTKEAEKGFNAFQEFVPKYFKEATGTYGSTLDGMIDGLSKVKDSTGKFIGKNIPTEDATALLSKVQQEAVDLGIHDSPVISKVRDLAQKYTDKGMNGRVDVRTFLNDIRDARNAIPSGTKEGSKYLTHKDMASSILNDNMGDFLTKFLPEGQMGTFSELQSAYKSIIGAKKIAYKMFQPSQEALGGKQGFLMLKRLGTKGIGGMTPQEVAFIDHIQSGSSFAKGAGDITKTLRNLKPKLIKDQVKSGVNKETAEKAFEQFKILAGSRKSELATRSSRVKSIEEAQKQANAIKNALGLGIGIAAAGSAIGVAAMRGAGADRQIQQIGN